MPRRRVIRSAGFLDSAHRLFPPASASGAPTFRLFEDGPLRGAEFAFARNFEAQPESVEGVGSVRYITIPPTPVFGPMVITACLLVDGTVEILSVIHDDGYWDMIAGDPAD